MDDSRQVMPDVNDSGRESSADSLANWSRVFPLNPSFAGVVVRVQKHFGIVAG